MVYALQAAVYFQNAARRNTVLGNLEAKFAADPQYGTPLAVAVVDRAGRPGIHVIARFVNKVDRDAMWSNLDTFFGSGGQGPVAGSEITYHDCTHDEPTWGPCVILDRRTY